MSDRSEIHDRENKKHPQWWRKEPSSDQDHQHVSDESVSKFMEGGFSDAEMERKIGQCVEAFATCQKCWRKWKESYNSALSGEMAVVGYGSVEHGDS